MENEKRLIDANRLKRRLERFEEFMVEFGNVEAAKATRAIIKGLKIMPIEDAVPVVRCKDCKHWECWRISVEGSGNCLLDIYGNLWNANDFCSYGERRTDERKAD